MIAGRKKSGRTTKAVSLTIDIGILEQVGKIAAKHERSLSFVITKILGRYLEKGRREWTSGSSDTP